MKITIKHGEVWVCIRRRFANTHCTNMQLDLLLPLHHAVLLVCTRRLVSVGRPTVEERVHCRQTPEVLK